MSVKENPSIGRIITNYDLYKFYFTNIYNEMMMGINFYNFAFINCKLFYYHVVHVEFLFIINNNSI